MKMGLLVGRPLGTKFEPKVDRETKERIIERYKWGVPLRRLGENFKIDRNTVDRWLTRLGCKSGRNFKKEEKERRRREIAHRKTLFRRNLRRAAEKEGLA